MLILFHTALTFLSIKYPLRYLCIMLDTKFSQGIPSDEACFCNALRSPSDRGILIILVCLNVAAAYSLWRFNSSSLLAIDFNSLFSNASRISLLS